MVTVKNNGGIKDDYTSKKESNGISGILASHLEYRSRKTKGSRELNKDSIGSLEVTR
jgi:hypothetical protein